jgi:hypothetical protein
MSTHHNGTTRHTLAAYTSHTNAHHAVRTHGRTLARKHACTHDARLVNTCFTALPTLGSKRLTRSQIPTRLRQTHTRTRRIRLTGVREDSGPRLPSTGSRCTRAVVVRSEPRTFVAPTITVLLRHANNYTPHRISSHPHHAAPHRASPRCILSDHTTPHETRMSSTLLKLGPSAVSFM